ncbi:2-dehydro-3-deoxygluconokinase [Bacillus inaquosorum]|uniref:2-dehydro-3-deoxygluconokinase n=1 Tax=Bacillus inaquosorum TaxID=483913 RepID=UPI002280AACC|nr:2-dehydro-3-deoxygluconokinase [Bacillus inaquosorum]MCY9307593.1 2-dehydro-3-deoxygluconokinase [Bacillus inaquosorum]
MKLDAVTFGESMAMFYANEYGGLHEASTFSKGLAGAESNVACGLARLGFQMGWMSKVGNDQLGTFILEALKKEGVDVSRVIRSQDGNPTGLLLKSKVKEGDPQVTYYRKNSAASTLTSAEYPREYFQGAGHLHVTGIPPALSAEMKDFTYHVMKDMKHTGKTVSLDPNLRPSLWPDQATMAHTINDLAGLADWFFPGITEGELLTGEKTPEGIADYYLKKGVSFVAIKLGKDGAYFKTRESEGFAEGFRVDRVVDTVGAGDGFAVGVISGILDGLSYKDAVQRGNAIGALQVQAPGDMDGLPTREKLAAFLSAQRTVYQKKGDY